MRFQTLADEFERIVEAIVASTPEQMRAVAARVRTRQVEGEIELLRSDKEVDPTSYAIGATEAASALLLTSAARMESKSTLARLQAHGPDLKALHLIGLWSDSALTDGEDSEARDKSQRALANAVEVSEGTVSRHVLPRLKEAGLVRQGTRSKVRRMEITEAGIVALDQLRPGWRMRDPITNEFAETRHALLEASHGYEVDDSVVALRQVVARAAKLARYKSSLPLGSLSKGNLSYSIANELPSIDKARRLGLGGAVIDMATFPLLPSTPKSVSSTESRIRQPRGIQTIRQRMEKIQATFVGTTVKSATEVIVATIKPDRSQRATSQVWVYRTPGLEGAREKDVHYAEY